MRRVVVTGYGIVSSIGNSRSEVIESLKTLRSGIGHNAEYEALGMRSHVSGHIELDVDALIDRKIKRFMGPGSAYTYIAMKQAIEHSGLPETLVSNPRTGLVVGSGGPSIMNQIEAVDIMREKGVKRIGPYMVPRCMSSTTSATLATPFAIKGVNYSMTSACATSAHCIGHGAELIQFGKQDIVFAGGGEEIYWGLTILFDAMGALSTGYHHSPQEASRPFDAGRDGFVISGGAGVVVLEDREHALKRGAPILAELVGYGATSDGYDMVAPSGEGAERCMKMALKGVSTPVDYINAHGTSTPVGDLAEARAISQVFGGSAPMISSTKSLTGHALGAAGVQEAIFSIMMLEEQFVSGTKNLQSIDPKIKEVLTEDTILRESVTNLKKPLQTVMSNSFGFGGTNATLVFAKP